MYAMEGFLVEAVEAKVVEFVEAMVVDDVVLRLWRICLGFGGIAVETVDVLIVYVVE